MARPPKTFASFVGQSRVVDTVQRLADGARESGRTVPHLLLVAAAGVGKTTLANALARYAGNFGENEEPTNLHTVQAGRRSIMQIHRVLCTAKPADFLFVDEAHALGEADAELLYVAIDRSQTLRLGDDGRLDRTVSEPIATITIILATNQPGRIPRALLSRSIILELDAYTNRELRAIAQRVASHHGVDLTAQAARVIAERANGSPRRVEQMLLMIDSVTPRGVRLTQSQVEAALTMTLGHDEYGLTPSQRRLLALLARPGALRAEQIVNALGLDPAYIRAEIEGPLMTRGLITVSGNHIRQITIGGRATLALGGGDDERDDDGEPEAERAT